MAMTTPCPRLRRCCCVAWLTLTLSACTSPLPRQAEALRNGTSCCASLAELPVSGTLSGKDLTVEIDERTSVFDFAQGRSYFVAVSIPRANGPRQLEVRTWHRGNSSYDQQIFCPVITVLDGGRRLIETLDLNSMNFTRAGLIDNARFTQTLPLPDNAEYAVVHEPSTVIGQGLRAHLDPQMSVIVLPAGAYVSRGSDLLRIPCGQQGRISLRLQ